jgi:16S rRNA (guanine966-N2)-methyltransferase
MTVRILQGSLRGKKLADHDAWVRPTSGYRRQMIFNRLHHAEGFDALDKLRVLDVFAGTGALGLEALSRGAAFVTFVEADMRTATKLETFIQNNNLAPKTRVVRAAIPDIAPCPDQPFDLCFLDAPYGQNLVPKALSSLHAQGWVHSNTLYIAETDVFEDLPLPSWAHISHKRTKGRTHVYFIRETASN